MKQAVINLIGGEITDASIRLAEDERAYEIEKENLAMKRLHLDHEAERIKDLQEYLDHWQSFEEKKRNA